MVRSTNILSVGREQRSLSFFLFPFLDFHLRASTNAFFHHQSLCDKNAVCAFWSSCLSARFCLLWFDACSDWQAWHTVQLKGSFKTVPLSLIFKSSKPLFLWLLLLLFFFHIYCGYFCSEHKLECFFFLLPSLSESIYQKYLKFEGHFKNSDFWKKK